MIRPHVLLLLIAACSIGAQASIFCPHTAYPSTADSEEFVVASIQSRRRPGQEAYYRITDDNQDPAYQRNSSRFRLMTTRDSGECPFRGCLVELSPAEPKNHGTRLYQTSLLGKMIPPGFFAMDVARRLYCVVTDGDCGATIPLYRHYRLAPSGIYHAYTLESDKIIDGYIREATPLCYVWPKNRPAASSKEVADSTSTLLPPLTDIINKLLPTLPTTTTAKPPKTPKSPKPASKSDSNEDNAVIESEDSCRGPDATQRAYDSSMKKLKEYANGEVGSKSDHWYTTRKPSSNYKQKAILGKIITDPKATNCKCLVQLSAMKYESDDKNTIDHKLVRTQIEPLSLYQYLTTGEELYCAHKEGSCGATVPLRKFYNLADSDTTMTAGSDQIPPNSAPAPADILCWIWPKNYHQDSTEEEIRQEKLNLVQTTAKSTEEESSEPVEGSGAEPPAPPKNTTQVNGEEQTKKTAVQDEPPKSQPKKAKKSKKHRSKKPKSKSAEKGSAEASHEKSSEAPKNITIVEKNAKIEQSEAKKSGAKKLESSKKVEVNAESKKKTGSSEPGAKLEIKSQIEKIEQQSGASEKPAVKSETKKVEISAPSAKKSDGEAKKVEVKSEVKKTETPSAKKSEAKVEATIKPTKKSSEEEKSAKSGEEVSAENQLGGDRILRFESADSIKPGSLAKSSGSEEASQPSPSSTAKSSSSSEKKQNEPLDQDEERVRELEKFSKRGGREPAEVEEQNDEESATVINFDN